MSRTDDPRETHVEPEGRDRILICGPPDACTCPAVAWACVCGASDVVPEATR
jgi:hypothetical protein